MRRQLLTGLLMTIALTVLLGVVYPLAVTGASELLFNHNANGSLVKDKAGAIVGSSLIGQQFVDANGNPDARYFQPRPSDSIGTPYNANGSAASNLGPSNPKLLAAVEANAKAYRAFNGLRAGDAVPVDAVTASGSGLDPDISPANAALQAARVAKARGLTLAQVIDIVHQHTSDRALGFIGEPVVNVLDVNLALDKLG
ncbi:MAG TPA: K(+)-transporting ATPase subunit C [Acidimicrobiia bacterium]|jgi:K+-transporting ATPase ATPase C chain